MQQQYKAQSTSLSSATVEDRILSKGSVTRKVMRPTIVDNPNNNDASIKITILHQKAAQGEFEDIPQESLTKLKAGDLVKLALSSAETRTLFDELSNLYAIHQKLGVPHGKSSLVVVPEEEIIRIDSRRADIIKELVDKKYSTEVWEQLIESDPDLATKLSRARLQKSRLETLEMFKQNLEKDLSEDKWQDFFEQNTWIFGYGLRYQILRTVATKPNYGGGMYDGTGGNTGDFLQSTLGNTGFTVLVEIKKPSTQLLKDRPYRNDAYIPSEDLAGGVSQLRSNAINWELDGSRTEKNSEKLKEQSIFTVKPKTILVIGDTKEIKTPIGKRISFEVFRRGLNDVEVLTFDELFQRAKFIVEHGNTI